MRVPVKEFWWAVVALFCCCFVACLGGAASMPAQFYMLNPVETTTGGQTGMTEQTTVRVSLEPVEIPRYLNRPQIVTHKDGTAYHVDEFNQWLEPLGDNITRVVGENLSKMLAEDGIAILTVARSIQTDFRIALQILRLDGNLGRQVELVARWSLFDQTGADLVVTRRSVFEEAVGDDSYRSFVVAQNRMVEALSREIAETIRPVVLK